MTGLGKDLVKVTGHAYKRGKERLKWGRSTMDRMSALSFQEGYGIEETKGTLKKYIKSLQHLNKHTQILIYGQVLYIFHGNVLVTLYQISHKYKKYLKT